VLDEHWPSGITKDELIQWHAPNQCQPQQLTGTERPDAPFFLCDCVYGDAEQSSQVFTADVSALALRLDCACDNTSQFSFS